MSSHAPSTASAESANGLAVFAAADLLATLSELLARLRRSPVVMHGGDLDTAVAWSAGHVPPTVLLVDIDAHPQPLAALARLSEQLGPGCHVVALGRRHDVDLYRRLLQVGAFDYLVAPLQLDLLAQTLQRADQNQPLTEAQSRMGRTVAVVGAGGGLGTSTLVAALGQWLAGPRQLPTVLVDFDRQKADLPLLLGLAPEPGLEHLLAVPEVDPRLLQRTLRPVGQGEAGSRLHLLAERGGAPAAVVPERVLGLGAALCERFTLSLWDLPSHRPMGSDEVLTHADVRVLLTELSVQGARSTQRLLAGLGDESGGQRLLLVSSGAHGESAVLSAEQMAEFIGRPIDLHMPHAGPALSASLMQGALAAPAAPAYAAAVARLGALLTGQPTTAAAAPPSLLGQVGRWLGLGRPRSAGQPA